MQEGENERRGMVGELIEYFQNEEFRILGARGIAAYSSPAPVANDGFGDQQDKTPDVLAYDDKRRCFVIGLVITRDENWESEELLTTYNVFLDQKDALSGKPHRLFILAPSSSVNDLTAFLMHYIHREYWHKLTIVASIHSS